MKIGMTPKIGRITRSVVGWGVRRVLLSGPAKAKVQAINDEHDDLVEWNLLERLHRDGLLAPGLTAAGARRQLDA